MPSSSWKLRGSWSVPRIIGWGTYAATSAGIISDCSCRSGRVSFVPHSEGAQMNNEQRAMAVHWRFGADGVKPYVTETETESQVTPIVRFLLERGFRFRNLGFCGHDLI